ncbi:DUF4435 domain-containing protein [Pectobacterium sp. CHL-2024]|uniref:DUF4435 domain-containing protein n=1 Tax=Pectobacterium sp. CHL-2024 TaxID=3377079 RepID=UPI0037F23F6E
MSKGIARGTRALSVINRFKRVSAVMYVEGPTDRVFWNNLLNYRGVRNISIEIAGSCTIIDEYILKIINENLNIYVARDKDYKFNLNKIPEHHRVLFSFGHSIENTLIYDESLISIVSAIGGDRNVCSALVQEWVRYITNQLQPLVTREFANEEIGSGISILGEHGNNLFGSNWNSNNFPQNKIAEKIAEVDAIIPHDKIISANNLVTENLSNVCCFIRGHFLFSLALKFVKEIISELMGKNSINISNDSLITMLSMNFRAAIADGTHPHHGHYMSELDKINIVAA